MSNRIITMELEDWSKLDKTDPFFYGADWSRNENFGIHTYNGNLWTSGFVGVGRLFGTNGSPLTTHGKEHVVIINSKYQMDPWILLEKVMTDEEYNDYIEELEKNGKYLFKIFYNQPVIQLTQNQNCESDILYALSFINFCYSLCKKGIKRKLIHKEENLTAKVRGRIDIQKNIRKNASNGRNDRFYCKYIDFSMDTIENRILKSALTKCKKIIERKFEMNSKIVGRLYYCMNALSSVKSVPIRNKDFNNVNVTGLYSYYKPLIKLAKCIIGQKYYSYTTDDGNTVINSMYTVPFMINMETVFEFYTRTIFKENIDKNRFYLEKYSKHIYLENGVCSNEDVLTGIHLMPYCIPDIIICDKITHQPFLILDAKYKQDDRPVREDSHQLLTYVLMSGVNKCGFVLPAAQTHLKEMRGNSFLILNSPLFHELKYYELFLGNGIVKTEIDKILI